MGLDEIESDQRGSDANEYIRIYPMSSNDIWNQIESDETRLDYMILEKILLYQIRLH